MRSHVVAAALLVAAACGDDGASGDAAIDGAGDTAVDGGRLVVAQPAAPTLTPCPTGFVSVGEPPRCDPFGGAPRQTCTTYEAQLPGESACRVLGAECPPGDWAEVPPGSDVRYVRSGATAGGDGTMGAPFATISEGVAGASAGTVVAVAKGTYAESFYVPAGVTVWGACASETLVTSSTPSLAGEGVITVATSGGRVRDIAVSGARDGVVIRDGSDLMLDGVVVSEATRTAITVFPDATVTGDGVLVRDVIVGADGRLGGGLVLGPGATATMTRFAAIGCTAAAISAYGSTALLEDSLLADGRAQPLDGLLGVGVDAFAGADVTLRRTVIEGNRNRALMVYEADTIVRVEESVVRDTAGRDSDGREGRGAFVFEGATLSIARSWMSGHHDVAILVTDEVSRVELEDVVIESTEGTEADGLGGSAVALQGGATGSLRRAWIEQSRGIAVVAFGGSTLSTFDVMIRDTESETIDGRFGVGLHAQSGATIEGERVAIVRTRQAGISAGGAGSTVTLTDVRVEESRERACAMDTCAGLGIGDGVVAIDGATISLDGFEIRRSARAGAHLAADGTMDLRRGLIADNPIGAVVQTAGFDVARISDDVVYQDNARNLDMSALAIPEPPTGF